MKTLKIIILFSTALLLNTTFAQDGVRSVKSTTTTTSKKEVTGSNKTKSATVDSATVDKKHTNKNTDPQRTVKK